jgi:hypothetical protein
MGNVSEFRASGRNFRLVQKEPTPSDLGSVKSSYKEGSSHIPRPKKPRKPREKSIFA